MLVLDADDLYQAFVDGLRHHYGKLPIAGIPRITRPNNNNSAGYRRFNVIDPGGNWIRFGQKVETPKNEESISPKTTSTRLSRAIQAADLLADSKGDYAAAAKTLDAALARDEPESTVHRVQALVARATVAITMGDQSLARSILTEIRQLPLHDDEHAALIDELQRADDLHMLQ